MKLIAILCIIIFEVGVLAYNPNTLPQSPDLSEFNNGKEPLNVSVYGPWIDDVYGPTLAFVFDSYGNIIGKIKKIKDDHYVYLQFPIDGTVVE